MPTPENNNPSVASSLIGAGGSVATGVIGLIGDAIQYKRQKDLIADARAYDRERFDLENAYNSPMAQVQRLKDAGLNPALMYGNSASTGNTNGMSVSEIPQAPQSGATFSQSAANAVNAALVASETEKNKAETRKMDSEKTSTDAHTDFFLKSMDDMLHGIKLQNSFTDTQIEETKVNIERFKLSCDQLVNDIALTSQALRMGDLDYLRAKHTYGLALDFGRKERQAQLDSIYSQINERNAHAKSLIGNLRLLNATFQSQVDYWRYKASSESKIGGLYDAQTAFYNSQSRYQDALLNYLPYQYMGAISQSAYMFEHNSDGSIKFSSDGTPVPNASWSNTQKWFGIVDQALGIFSSALSSYGWMRFAGGFGRGKGFSPGAPVTAPAAAAAPAAAQSSRSLGRTTDFGFGTTIDFQGNKISKRDYGRFMSAQHAYHANKTPENYKQLKDIIEELHLRF